MTVSAKLTLSSQQPRPAFVGFSVCLAELLLCGFDYSVDKRTACWGASPPLLDQEAPEDTKGRKVRL
ncbi:MAG: hypothetical protein RLZZ227_226 [Pseudomonadota bacterium]|jgi:hypothetical protein